jgi:hypothetical protein
MSDNDEFSALRAIKTAKQHLLASPDKVFPFLCPTREYDWIEPWKCRMVQRQLYHYLTTGEMLRGVL